MNNNLAQADLEQIFQQHENDADEPEIDLLSYDTYVCFSSSGKDSTSGILYLLEQGVDPKKIEVHHHAVDSMDGSSDLMDWPCTEAYLEAFCEALNLKLFWSFKKGGFEKEMNRSNELTAPIVFQDENWNYIETGGLRGVPNTRLKFPQVSADLRVRWCSSYLKIDVGARMITSQKRFTKGKHLVCTFERAAESANRSRYKTFERHRTDRRDGKRVTRWIDHYRPTHKWDEYEVWSIIQRWGIRPHPCYYIGFHRCSCLTCIFASADQWATIKHIANDRFEKIAQYEESFGVTIQRKKSVRELAEHGQIYDMDLDLIKQALSSEYDQPIMVNSDDWIMPSGAFKAETAGP